VTKHLEMLAEVAKDVFTFSWSFLAFLAIGWIVTAAAQIAIHAPVILLSDALWWLVHR
jgi:hypothetical protein